MDKQGWEQVKPEGFQYDSSLYQEYAFSGIHVLSPAIFQWMTSLMGWKILYHGFLSCHLPASKLWWLLDRKVASD